MTPRRIVAFGTPGTYDPRNAVLDRLAKAYETHAEAEQLARAKGDKPTEWREHGIVLRLLRAYTAEAL